MDNMAIPKECAEKKKKEILTEMKRKDLWARLSSCTMAALIATTSVVPTYGADFSDGTVMEQTQETEDVVEADTVESSADAVEEIAETDAADVFTDDVQTEEFSSDVAVQADEQAEAQTGFGTANTQLAKGTYTVKASLMKGNDPTSASMAGSCIAGDATMVVAEDGSATVTVPIQSVTVMGMTGNAEQWKIYKGDTTTETTDASATTGEDGKVNSITFTIPDKSQDGVYVNMYIDLMQTTQDAFLKLDYANAQPVKAPVDTAALEATIAQADALDEMSYTKASWDGNKDAIEAAKTAAKAALEAKESQEAVDAANTALADAVGKLVAAGNQTDIKAALAEAKALNENDYTVKTWKYVQDAIDKAETVIANRDTKTNLRRAKNSLTLWMGHLEVKYDTTALEKKIAQAEALNKDDYTAESWKAAALANVINAAKETIDNRGNKDDVHDAIESIENAIDKLVPVSNEVIVGRGNFQKKLAPGTYSLPLELLNGGRSEATNQYTSANYMSQVSMAAGCFTDNATLVIHEDGTATLTAGVQAISAMGLSGAASDWTIYESTQDYLDGTANANTGARFKARVDESKVQAGKKKPSKISFTIPDLKQNVVATRMYIEVMSVNQDACIGLDWSNVEKISDDTSETSTVEKEYVVNADTLTQLKNMKAGSTVKLDEDVTLTEDLTIKGGTLDLNGHVLAQKDNLIMIKGDVTVIDSSAEKTGKITRERYSATSKNTTSISVQKGSFTADGITIDGQIGNRIYTGSQSSLMDNPRVTVKLTNCTLINTVQTETMIGGSMNVAFANLNNGIDIIIDSCTADKGVYVSGGTGEKTVINNSTLGELNLSGASASVTNVTGTGRASIGADEMTISDDSFAGLTIGGTGDVTLENVVSQNSVSYQGALDITGSGQVTIKSGVYANEAGIAVRSQGFPIKLEGGYTKASYAAAKAVYDEIDGSADEDIAGDVVTQKAKELNDAMAALEAPASEASVKALKDAVAAAKKVSSKYYSTTSYTALTKAVTAAEKLLAGGDASDSAVKAATDAVKAAQKKLVKLTSQSITGVSSKYSRKYKDKAFTLKAKAKTTISYKSSNEKVVTVDKNGKVTIKGAGTAKITVTAKKTTKYCEATKTITITVAKISPTVKTSVSTKTYKYATIKKKAQVFTLGASVNSKGTLSYKKLSGSSAIKIDAKTGKLTVKKGLKKGTYKVKVQIKAAARGSYNAGSKTVTVTVKVK